MDVEFKRQSSTSPSRLSPLAEPFQPFKQQSFSHSVDPSKDNSQYVASTSLIDHFPDAHLDDESLSGFGRCAAQPLKDHDSAFPFDREENYQSEVSKCSDDWESVLVATLGQNRTEELYSSVTSICTGQSSGFGDRSAWWTQESTVDGEVSICSKEKCDLVPVDQSLKRKGTCVFDGSPRLEIPSDDVHIKLPENFKRDGPFRSQLVVHVKTPASNLRVKSIKGKSEDLSETSDYQEVPNLGKLGNQRHIFTNNADVVGTIGSSSNSKMKKNENSYYNQVCTLKLPHYEEQSLALQGKGHETGKLDTDEADCLPNFKYGGDITSLYPFGSTVKKPLGPGFNNLFEDSFTMINKDDMDENVTHVGCLRKTQNVPKSTSAVSGPPEVQLPANIMKACTGLNPQAPLFFPKHADWALKSTENESTLDDSSCLQKTDAAAAYSEASACAIKKELSALGILCLDEVDEQKRGHHRSGEISSLSPFDLEKFPSGNLAPIENEETERKLNRNLADIADADVNDEATLPVDSTEYTSGKPLYEIGESSLVENPSVSGFLLAARGFDVYELVDVMHHLSELFVRKCPETFLFAKPLLAKIHRIINNLATSMKNGDGWNAPVYEPLPNSLSVLNPSASTSEGVLSSKESEEYHQVFDGFSGSPTSTLESTSQIVPQIKEQIDAGYVSFPKLAVKVKSCEGKGKDLHPKSKSKDTTSAKCSNNQTSNDGTNKKLFLYNSAVLVEKSSDDITVETAQNFCGDRTSIMALQCCIEESPKKVKRDQHGIDVKSSSLTLGNNGTCRHSKVDINTNLSGADIINPAEDSFIVVEKNEFEENDTDIDSPCWKGLRNMLKNPSGEFGPLDPEVPKKLPEARNSLNPQAPLFFPCYGDKSSNYDECEGIGDVSPLKTVSAATACSQELPILSNEENRLCCSETHFSTGVHCSNDKPCSDDPLMDSTRSSLFSSDLVQPLFKEGQLGSVLNMDIQMKANLDGSDKAVKSTKFNNAPSVSFQGLDDILAESLIAYGSSILIGNPSGVYEFLSTSGLDVNKLITSMHFLSELLVKNCFSGNFLNEQAHDKIQVINEQPSHSTENGDRQSSSKSLKGKLAYSNNLAIKGN